MQPARSHPRQPRGRPRWNSRTSQCQHRDSAHWEMRGSATAWATRTRPAGCQGGTASSQKLQQVPISALAPLLTAATDGAANTLWADCLQAGAQWMLGLPSQVEGEPPGPGWETGEKGTPHTYFLGKSTKSVTAKMMMKSKIISLYISCPTWVSQH